MHVDWLISSVIAAQPVDNDGDTDGGSKVRDTPPAPAASNSPPPHRGQKVDLTA